MKIPHRALFAAAALALAGCESYRVHFPGQQALHAEKTGHRYVSIEFGEQGNARDPSQIDVAKREIAKLRKPLLVVFVHGWHNNAETAEAKNPDELPKHAFSQLLDTLSTSAFIRERGFQPLGVYISWRGKMYDDFLAEYATTFWNRFAAGRSLGQSVACRAAISDLVAEARKKGERDSRTFLIGHSFGGLVLEQAITDSVTSAFQNGRAYPPADLTLFLNSASDSETTRQIIQRLSSSVVRVRNWSEHRDFPIFASLTSESDWATGFTFPIGRYPAALGKQFDSFEVSGKEERVSGRYFFTHTPGHNRYLLSHATSAPEAVSAAGRGTSAFEENLRSRMDPERPLFKTWSPEKKWEQWRLERCGSTATPYWVVKVSKPIMDGHNQIFNDNGLALMAALYRLNSQFTEETGTKPMMEATAAPRGPVKLQSGATAAANVNQVMRQTPAQTAPAQKATPPPAAPLPATAPARPRLKPAANAPDTRSGGVPPPVVSATSSSPRRQRGGDAAETFGGEDAAATSRSSLFRPRRSSVPAMTHSRFGDGDAAAFSEI